MGSNLQDRIVRGVHDEVSCLHLMLSILLDDFGTACRLVANKSPFSTFPYVVEWRFGEADRISFERLFNIKSCNFPVAGHRVFALGNFARPAVECRRIVTACHSREGIDAPEAESFQ